MSKIVRTPTRAEGGITLEEKAKLDEVAKFWIANAMRTDKADINKLAPAIHGIYAAAGLKKPRVVLVPSPMVMAAAYGASAAIWYLRKKGYDATDAATDAATRSATRAATRDATDAATDAATRSATYDATDAATDAATDDAIYAATRSATDDATDAATRSATRAAIYDATDAATRSAIYAATYDATDDAMAVCREIAGEFGVGCAKLWWRAYQGGNMWSHYDSYLCGARDVLGLRLPEHEKYAHWEQASLNGGFRVMHEEFCIVSDFPEVLKVDENNLPHCENGPSHRWRDGWEIYHWHGVKVPAHWIMSPETVDPSEVLSEQNVEVRAAGIAIIGMAKMLDKLQHRIVDSDPDPMKGDLVEVRLPDLPDPVYYLSAHCPRNGRIMEAVNPSEMDEMTVKGAQAWRLGIPASEFVYPTVRT